MSSLMSPALLLLSPVLFVVITAIVDEQRILIKEGMWWLGIGICSIQLCLSQVQNMITIYNGNTHYEVGPEQMIGKCP